jgi:FkbM family methyltransferase
MKTLACLLILPEFKDINHVTRWEENLKWATEIYIQYPYPDTSTIDIEKRWALGYVAWNRLIEYNKNPNIQVYFVRTDYRIPYGTHTIQDNIISVGFTSPYGHILHKTLIGFKILSNFDFVVRGNINTIIDIFSLYDFLKPIRTTDVFTSPFWEGGDYAFGYFILLSKDIVNYLANVKITDDPRWLTEDTADDYELSRIILKKHIQIMLVGCDVPWGNTSDSKPHLKKNNQFGIRFNDVDDSSNVLTVLKDTPDSVFLYRVRSLQDKKYIPVYKQIIKHIWNKVVKKTYSDLVVYNELGYKVPHLEYERDEQLLVSHYITENDTVLELGARYGSVSCIINKILKNKKNQVSVEPDNTVWDALERTKRENKCEFIIYKGIISSQSYDLKLNGYGSTVDITNSISNMQSIKTEHMSLDELQQNTGLKFNVLVADCEGFLETFLEENPFLYNQLDLIIFECDRPDVCNYAKIKTNLSTNHFKVLENGFQCAFKKMY